MIHTNKAMNNCTPIVGTVEVIAHGPTGVTALVDGKQHVFPDLDAVFRAAVDLLEKPRGGGIRAIQQELIPMRRSFP
jgi:hypothetical protein